MHDRFARREDALRIHIRRRVTHIADHVLGNFFGRVKAEYLWIAGIELDDALAFFFHLAGAFEHRATDFVADVGQFVRFVDFTIHVPFLGGRGEPRILAKDRCLEMPDALRMQKKRRKT